jgi:hypothetical protein
LKIEEAFYNAAISQIMPHRASLLPLPNSRHNVKIFTRMHNKNNIQNLARVGKLAIVGAAIAGMTTACISDCSDCDGEPPATETEASIQPNNTPQDGI